MDVPVTPFKDYPDALNVIGRRLELGQKTMVAAVNPEKVYRAQREQRLRDVLQNAEIGLCDGIGTVIAAYILHGDTVRRITGIQLFLDLMGRAETCGWRIFLLGASPESSEAAAARLKVIHPGLCIVGRQDGYFENSEAVIAQINESRAQMLFVAMGSPRQEFWIAEHRAQIDAPFCMGIGGTLDVLSGHARWAPKFFRVTGTEFLYRLLSDPRRWRRQLVLPLFLLNVIKVKLTGQKNRQEQ